MARQDEHIRALAQLAYHEYWSAHGAYAKDPFVCEAWERVVLAVIRETDREAYHWLMTGEGEHTIPFVSGDLRTERKTSDVYTGLTWQIRS